MLTYPPVYGSLYVVSSNIDLCFDFLPDDRPLTFNSGLFLCPGATPMEQLKLFIPAAWMERPALARHFEEYARARGLTLVVVPGSLPRMPSVIRYYPHEKNIK